MRSNILKFIEALKVVISYGSPAQVTEAIIYPGGDLYPLCPRCGLPIEYDYASFCLSCGQRLDWESFSTYYIEQNIARALARYAETNTPTSVARGRT